MVISFILGIVIALSICSITALILYNRLKKKHDYRIKKERDNAITLSRRTVKGQLAELMFPWIQKQLMGYELGDMLFIGKLVDYIIVDGYNEAKDADGEIRKVIFMDIKTGNAKLSKHQEKLKQAIEAGRVEWKTITITDAGKIKEK